jgi:ArsR family transcriptional regulator
MTTTASTSTALTDEQFHAIGRALADPRRYAILQQIAAAEGLACSALREHQVISPATISHHLKELHEAGLVNIEREGRSAILFLCRPTFAAYLQRLASL